MLLGAGGRGGGGGTGRSRSNQIAYSRLIFETKLGHNPEIFHSHYFL